MKASSVGKKMDPTRQFDQRTTFSSNVPAKNKLRRACGESHASHRERPKNSQSAIKSKLAKQMQKINEIDVVCGDKPWQLCDQKPVSLLYLFLWTEGPRIFKKKIPSFPNWETAFQGSLASDGQFIHQNSEYYLRPFRFLFFQTTKRWIGGKIRWTLNRTSRKL